LVKFNQPELDDSTRPGLTSESQLSLDYILRGFLAAVSALGFCKPTEHCDYQTSTRLLRIV